MVGDKGEMDGEGRVGKEEGEKRGMREEEDKIGSAGVGLWNEMWRSRSIENREAETGKE